MSIKDPRLHRTQCSANSLYRMRKSCAQKELQSHGVEDGLERHGASVGQGHVQMPLELSTFAFGFLPVGVTKGPLPSFPFVICKKAGSI